jgi:hypothetical protein
MKRPFQDAIARHPEVGTPERQEELSRSLDEACRNLARALLACPPTVRQDLLAALVARVLAMLDEVDALARQLPASPERAGMGNWNLPGVTDGFPFAKLSPELLEWFRQQVNEEEVIAGLREIEETGGLELSDFLPELERAAGLDEENPQPDAIVPGASRPSAPSGRETTGTGA